MPSLSKATLQEIDASSPPKILGEAIPLQFNPQSLKLALANKVEGGDSVARQKRQYLGKTSTTLSFDLMFDTADQGTTDKPVSVRTQTAMVERFVLPKGKGNDKQKPPKCRFSWDALVIDGIIEDIIIDFELFAANGTPLRAKLGVTIKEQDAKYELLQTGPGANNANSATPPGKPGTGPGSSGAGPTDRSAQALGGESAADFAVRMGLDPSAWRGIAGQLGGAGSLSLSAGLSIGFSASLSASAGIGIAAGIDVGSSASVEASFGLGAGIGLGAGGNVGVNVGVNVSGGADAAEAARGAGFALAAAGGLGAALESVAIVKSEAAAGKARAAFGSAVPAVAAARTGVAGLPSRSNAAGLPSRGTASLPSASAAALAAPPGLPPPSVNPKPALPDQLRTPLKMSGAASLSQQAAAAPAPAPPRADPRAASFGFGVPLRPRVGSAADLRADAAAGRIALRPRQPLIGVQGSNDPSAPPWTRLPADAGRGIADKTQARRSPRRPCGCTCK